MSETTFTEGVAVTPLYQEWVQPQNYWKGDGNRPFTGAIAVQTNYGYILLAQVEQYSNENSGGIRRRLLRPEEVTPL